MATTHAGNPLPENNILNNLKKKLNNKRISSFYYYKLPLQQSII